MFVISVVTCNKKTNTINYYQSKIASITDTVHTYRLKTNNLVSEKRSWDVERQHIRKTDIQKDKTIKSLKVKLKNLQSKTDIVTTTTDTLTIALNDTIIKTAHDTIYASVFKYNDRWLDVRGVVINDTLDLEYQSRDSISIVRHSRKAGFLKKETYISIMSHNPKGTISGIRDLNIKPRKKRWFETRGAAVAGGFLLGSYICIRSFR